MNVTELNEELKVLEEELQKDLDHVSNNANPHDDMKHMDIARKHTRIYHIKALLEGNPIPDMPAPADVPPPKEPLPSIPGLLVEKTTEKPPNK